MDTASACVCLFYFLLLFLFSCARLSSSMPYRQLLVHVILSWGPNSKLLTSQQDEATIVTVYTTRNRTKFSDVSTWQWRQWYGQRTVAVTSVTLNWCGAHSTQSYVCRVNDLQCIQDCGTIRILPFRPIRLIYLKKIGKNQVKCQGRWRHENTLHQ